MKLTSGTFLPERFLFRGANSEEVALVLGAQQGVLTGSVRGMIDLSWAELLVEKIVRSHGYGNFDLGISGIAKSPVFQGQIDVQNGFVQLSGLASSIEEIQGKLKLKGSILEVAGLSATIAQGRAQALGQIEFFIDRVPKIDVDLSLKQARLEIFPFRFLQTTGKIKLAGNELPYRVTGDVFVDHALTTEKLLGRPKVTSTKISRYAPVQESKRGQVMDLLTLDIGVNAPRGIELKNDLFNGEARAAIRLLNTLDSPVIQGSADMVSGKMLFNDREFQVQTAGLIFDTPHDINPKLNLAANTVVHQTKINVYVTGRLDSMKIEFTSDPPLSEQDITQLLAMGVTTADLKKFKTGEGASLNDVISLVLNSLEFNRDFQEKTGFQLQLDEVVDDRTGQSAFQATPNTLSATASPKVVIKRQIGSKFDVSVGSTVGVGSSTQRQFNAEYRFLPNWSVQGAWDSMQGVNTQERTSWGFDLKYQKRFK
jgi:translocation and assembly module TamB